MTLIFKGFNNSLFFINHTESCFCYSAKRQNNSLLSIINPGVFMKKYARFMAFIACALMLLIGLSPASAHTSQNEMVRRSQMRLADLGYYAGRYDGIIGPATRTALKDFQSHNGLTASGRLTTQTYDALVAVHDKQAHGRTTHYVATAGVDRLGTAVTKDPWHYVGTETIPVRFGTLKINEDAWDIVHRFTITLNDRPFLRADNQPGPLRVSEVFQLRGEDAILITAYRGERNCLYKNYLVTVHANGTSASSREFQSCAPSSEVHEAFDALFVRFPGTMNKDGWSSWDVWRYENAKLERL
jgi:hypothetical protein